VSRPFPPSEPAGTVTRPTTKAGDHEGRGGSIGRTTAFQWSGEPEGLTADEEERDMRGWSARRWWAAAVATVGSSVLLGLPTALIPNPVFARRIEAPLWTYPALLVTAVLAGLLLATYVRDDVGVAAGLEEASSEEARNVTVGGMLAFFAIGCPTCNKLVLIALGSSGAITWFEPLQPVLSVSGIVLLAWALRRRLGSSGVCAVPAAAERT
jgi:hypothetical protein